MKLSSNNLIGLPVETETGRKLGKLESFNIETESQSVLEYKIKPSSLIKGLISNDLIVSRGQVIEITDKKITVEDLIVKEKQKNKVKSRLKEKAVQGAAMKEK